MTITADINVLLDVFQSRHPHYTASAHVLGLVTSGEIRGVFPSHGLTTLYYLVRKHATRTDAESALDRVLQHFHIGNLDAAGWQWARRMPLADFEDAAVAAVAGTTQSDFIITRNTGDFREAPVPAIAPADFLSRLPAKPGT